MIADYEFLNQITNNSNEEEHMKMSDSRLSSEFLFIIRIFFYLKLIFF